MTQSEKAARAAKAQSLAISEMAGDRWLVTCESAPTMRHQVRFGKSQGWSCSCMDWRKNHEADRSWTCKHILAVQQRNSQATISIEDAKANNPGSQKERINLEVAAMCGDPEAARRLNSQVSAPQTQEAVEEPPLDPCSECGIMLPASQMIPWPAPGGSGMVCSECHQAHKEVEAEARAQDQEKLYSWREAEQSRQEALRQIAELPGPAPRELLEKAALPKTSTEAGAIGTANVGCIQYEIPPSVPKPLALAKKIAQANKILEGFGPQAIDADHTGRAGYGIQWTLDAMNQALGVDGWRYELLDHQVGDKRATVSLALYLRLDDGSWLTKGPVFGSSQNNDPGDALKGAVSDGLKKGASHWSIGAKAYRGELKK